MTQCLRFVLNKNKLIEKTIIFTVPVFGWIMLSDERNYYIYSNILFNKYRNDDNVSSKDISWNYFDEDFNFNWNMDKSWISLSTVPMIHRMLSSQFSFFDILKIILIWKWIFALKKIWSEH